MYVCVTSSRCRELRVGSFDVSHEKLGPPRYCTTQTSYQLDGDEADGHAGIGPEVMWARVCLCVENKNTDANGPGHHRVLTY